MSIDSNVPYEMKVVYIQRRKADIEECLKAIDAENFSFLEKIGHQVKGNAQSFGFDELSPLGIALEIAAKTKDLPKAKSIVLQFSKTVEEIKIASPLEQVNSPQVGTKKP